MPTATAIAAPTEPAPTRHARRRTDLVLLGVAVVLAGWVTLGLWADPAGRAITVNSGDQALFEWLLAYGAHAVTHGADPFFTHLLNVPDGVNLAVNTSITVLAVVLAPVTLLFGPPVAFLVALAANLVASAYAWYWVFSRPFGLRPGAAAVGGLFCGFAPGVISHANAHLNWTAQWLVPLLVWRVLALREPGRWLRNGLILGALVAVAFSIAAEQLFFTALACAIFLPMWACARENRAAARVAWAPFWRGLAVAAACAGVLLAYPLWLHFAGAQRYAGTGFDARIHSEDLAAWWSFPDRSLAGGAGLHSGLAPNPTEENSFLGWPLLLLAVACARMLFRHKSPVEKATLRAVLLTGGVFALLSLGPVLHVAKHRLPVPLPYWLLGRVPVFDAALPARLALVVVPVVGLLLAWALDCLFNAGPPRRLVVIWSAAFAAGLLPLVPLPLHTTSRAPVPHFIASGGWRSQVPADGVIVPLPLTNDLLPDGQRWQAYALAHGRSFRIPSGFFLGPGGPDGRGRIGPVPRPTAALLEQAAATGVVPSIGPAERAAARADLAYWHATIAVLPDEVHGAKWPVHVDAVRDAATQLLGVPQRVDDVWLWRVG